MMTKLKSIPVWAYCIILIISGCSIMMNGILNMRKGEYACIPVSIANSVISVCALCILLYRISPFVDEKLPDMLQNEIKHLGWVLCDMAVLQRTND